MALVLAAGGCGSPASPAHPPAQASLPAPQPVGAGAAGGVGVPPPGSADREIPRATGNDGAVVIVVLPEAVRVTIPDVLFEFGEADLRPDADAALADLRRLLMDVHKTANAEIVGYTDSVGSVAFNQTLSERRAESVLEWLEAQGVARGRFHASGKGEADPVGDNSTPEGRQKNRRVEVLIQTP